MSHRRGRESSARFGPDDSSPMIHQGFRRGDESSPFPFSPASDQSYSSNPSITKNNPSNQSRRIPTIPYNQSPDKSGESWWVIVSLMSNISGRLVYRDFHSNSRKASFESEDGKPQGEVELCMTHTDDDSSIVSTSIICDPEHEIITTKSGKVKSMRQSSKHNPPTHKSDSVAPSSALRGLDQSVIFRDSPRGNQRKSKLNAQNGISANYKYVWLISTMTHF